MRLKPYKAGNEPGNATKVVTLVKNVQTCRNSLYNLRHRGNTHFCHFGLERYSTTFDPAAHVRAEKETQYSEKYKFTYNTEVYDDVKLSSNNSR